MLRKFLANSLPKGEEKGRFSSLRPLFLAIDNFFFETPSTASSPPYIHDPVDMKRWMFLVLIALIPVFFFSLWNSGLYSLVYTTQDRSLLEEYLKSSETWQGYLSFALKENRFFTILLRGFEILSPLLLVSYLVGGFFEVLFAILRKKEISEGFLVTGILYVLILPSTIPYWMAAVGISFGVIVTKEFFGGSGMNIVNPALASRAFLFFAFPSAISGSVWVGSDAAEARQSLQVINQGAFDGYTSASKLSYMHISTDIRRIHVDAIASLSIGSNVKRASVLEKYLAHWNNSSLGSLSKEEMKRFVTTPRTQNGLGLSPLSYEDASHFASLEYNLDGKTDWHLFFGDKIGSLGETSVFACLLGAFFLLLTGVASWRTMAAMALGAYGTASLFEMGSAWLGADEGAWNSALYSLPAYKHLLLGGLAFGLVFMATDPVTSPTLNSAKWLYGAFCGCLTILIRLLNPAYVEGVMLAILTGNIFSPLFDEIFARAYIRRRKKLCRT